MYSSMKTLFTGGNKLKSFKRSLHVCLEAFTGSELAQESSQYVQTYRKMANTISNMKMTNPLKGLVSKKRKRYTQDGFNLDLSCILLVGSTT